MYRHNRTLLHVLTDLPSLINNMAAPFAERATFVFFIIFGNVLTKLTKSQPVVAEEFLYGERCGRSASSSEQLREHIDLIMDELRRQNLENMLLKDEVEQLKRKHGEQKLLLTQLTETVGELVQKIKHGQKTCTCPSPAVREPEQGVLSGSIAVIEPPGEADPPSTTPTSQTSQASRPGTDVTSAHSTGKSTVTPKSPVTGFQPVVIAPHDVLTSPRTGEPSTTFSPQSSQSKGASMEDEMVTEAPRSGGYVAVYPRDCQDLRSSTPIVSGQYTIFPVNASNPFRVYCQLDGDSVWTVIQRREGGQVDFYRNWSDYRDGFGLLTGEFWIGNEHIHELTRQAKYKLRIDMWDWRGEVYFAESSYFYVSNESDYYTLHSPDDYYAYSGFGGSGLRVHRGPFMTHDRQDPEMISDNCAQKFRCGWWFTTCVRNANLNGKYYTGGYENISQKSRNVNDIYWHSIGQSLKKVVMRVQRTDGKMRMPEGYS